MSSLAPHTLSSLCARTSWFAPLLALLLVALAPVAAVADDAPAADGTKSADEKQACQKAAQLGITDTKPESGHFVQVGDKYMIPYTTKIPGTEVEYTMMPIPGGEFLIGSPEGEAKRSKDEGPQRTIVLEPFWMAKFEVTWGEYKEYMKLYEVFKMFELEQIRQVTDDNQADAITAPTQLYDPSYTYGVGEDPQQPAVTMTQYAAKQYTKWISGITGRQYRLPSEAEWEYACRAGSKTAYHFGDDASKLSDYAWFDDNADGRPGKVGKKKPNAWGLHDMHGNVWEWVLDQYHEKGYSRLSEEPTKAVDAVSWPDVFYPRVLRGGSWDDKADRSRSAAKFESDDESWRETDPNLPLSPWWYSDDPATSIGFRIMRPLKMVDKKEMAKYWQPAVEDVQDEVDLRLIGGRGVQGLSDKDLPAAIKKLKAEKE